MSSHAHKHWRMSNDPHAPEWGGAQPALPESEVRIVKEWISPLAKKESTTLKSKTPRSTTTLWGEEFERVRGGLDQTIGYRSSGGSHAV